MCGFAIVDTHTHTHSSAHVHPLSEQTGYHKWQWSFLWSFWSTAIKWSVIHHALSPRHYDTMTHPSSVCFKQGNRSRGIGGQSNMVIIHRTSFFSFFFRKHAYFWEQRRKNFTFCPRAQPSPTEIIPQIPMRSRSHSHQWFIWHDWHYLLPLATSMRLPSDPSATMLFETTLSSVV